MQNREYEKSLQNVVKALEDGEISIWTNYKLLIDGYIYTLDEQLKLEEIINEIKNNNKNKNTGIVNRIFHNIEISKELALLNKQNSDVNSVLKKYEDALKCAHCFYKLDGTKENLDYVTTKSAWNKVRIEELEKKKQNSQITNEEEKKLSRLYVFQSHYNELLSILDERYKIQKEDEEYEKKVEEMKKNGINIHSGSAESFGAQSPAKSQLEMFAGDNQIITPEYNQEEFDSESKGKTR